MANTGYINGSDLLVFIDGKAVGHCTSHTTTISAETKDRAVKPVATASVGSAGLFKNKGVTGISVSISAEGLSFYNETENGYAACMALAAAGQSVAVKCLERGNDEKPYLSGNFVITSLERTAPANDDTTYSISLENDGVVTFDDKVMTDATSNS
jgi:predicted secreted protein